MEKSIRKNILASGVDFGPEEQNIVTVKEIVNSIKHNWPKLNYVLDLEQNKVHEANLLKLDCSKSWHYLRWKPTLNFNETINFTIDWYKGYIENKSNFDVKKNFEENIKNYINKAHLKNIEWCK